MTAVQSISVTTDASGDATVYSTPIEGRIIRFYHSGQLDAGADIVVTGEDSGIPILTVQDAGAVAASRYPVCQVHNAANGVALTLDGLRKNVDSVFIKDYERVKVVVAQGGNAQSGTFKILTNG